MNGLYLQAVLDGYKAENETLRTRLAELEKQEPASTVVGHHFRYGSILGDTLEPGTKLFAAPVVSPDVAGKYDWLQEQHLKVIAENLLLKADLGAMRRAIIALREFSLDQWWYSELKSILDFREVTDDTKRAILGVIPNLIGQIHALPHDVTPDEYSDKARSIEQ